LYPGWILGFEGDGRGTRTVVPGAAADEEDEDGGNVEKLERKDSCPTDRGVSDSTELDETDVVPDEEVLVSTVGELIDDGTRFSIRTDEDLLLLSLLTSDGVAGGTFAYELQDDELGLLRVGVVQGAAKEEEEVSSRSCCWNAPAVESVAVQSIAETISVPKVVLLRFQRDLPSEPSPQASSTRFQSPGQHQVAAVPDSRGIVGGDTRRGS
jgi:hypothetical protein